MLFSIKNILCVVPSMLRWLFMWTMALVILFEEWGWESLQRLLSRVVHGLHLYKPKSWLQELPPMLH